MATVVVIVNGRGLAIGTRRRHKPHKSQLAQYKALIHCTTRLKQLYSSNKTERLSYKVGVAYVNVRVSRRLKEELGWAIDKQLRLIINKMSFKTVIPLRI